MKAGSERTRPDRILPFLFLHAFAMRGKRKAAEGAASGGETACRGAPLPRMVLLRWSEAEVQKGKTTFFLKSRQQQSTETHDNKRKATATLMAVVRQKTK